MDRIKTKCTICGEDHELCDPCPRQRCDCDNCGQTADWEDLHQIAEYEGYFCEDCIESLHFTQKEG